METTHANGGKKLAPICRTNLIQICCDGFAAGYNQLTLCDLIHTNSDMTTVFIEYPV